MRPEPTGRRDGGGPRPVADEPARRSDADATSGRPLGRRTFLAATAAGLGTVAGCTSRSSEGGSDATVAVGSFFTFYDFARKIAADTPVAIENLVPVGLHGHGWEPDPSITRDIIDADAFVHVGEEFQPWADRAIQTVEDDDADTHLINVREGIELIDLAAGLTEEEEVGQGQDPHFWLDPTRAKQSVDTIRAGLAEVAPDHDAAFAENAAALEDRLDALDEEWAATFEAAEREVVFLAAHNAFGYLGDRYDATIRPLVTNLAASDDVRPEDMRRAREIIDDNDIRHIGAAVFEPLRPARQLLEESGIEAYFPVTPYAGTTEDWVDRGWGYFEIARNINLPTFEIVLGVSEPDESDLGEEWRNFER